MLKTTILPIMIIHCSHQLATEEESSLYYLTNAATNTIGYLSGLISEATMSVPKGGLINGSSLYSLKCLKVGHQVL